MARKSSGFNKFALGALLGAAAGAIVGLLTAPKSGKETRAELAGKAEDLKAKASDNISHISKAVQDSTKEAGDIANKHATAISDFAKSEATDLKADIADLHKQAK